MAAVWCGVDVSATRGHHLCVLTRASRNRLSAAFHDPLEAVELTRVVNDLAPAAVGVDAPSARCARLLGARSKARRALDLPPARYERARVCDALLMRRRLPLYQVPAAGEPVDAWMAAGFALFRSLRRAGLHLYRPPDAPPPYEAEATAPPHTASPDVFETYPDAAFCALLGHRPAKKSTPAGRRARQSALAAAGIDTDLTDRSPDHLDACAAALAAHRLTTGGASWLGHPREGVIVLPVPRLLPTYSTKP